MPPNLPIAAPSSTPTATADSFGYQQAKGQAAIGAAVGQFAQVAEQAGALAVKLNDNDQKMRARSTDARLRHAYGLIAIEEEKNPDYTGSPARAAKARQDVRSKLIEESGLNGRYKQEFEASAQDVELTFDLETMQSSRRKQVQFQRSQLAEGDRILEDAAKNSPTPAVAHSNNEARRGMWRSAFDMGLISAEQEAAAIQRIDLFEETETLLVQEQMAFDKLINGMVDRTDGKEQNEVRDRIRSEFKGKQREDLLTMVEGEFNASETTKNRIQKEASESAYQIFVVNGSRNIHDMPEELDPKEKKAWADWIRNRLSDEKPLNDDDLLQSIYALAETNPRAFQALPLESARIRLRLEESDWNLLKKLQDSGNLSIIGVPKSTTPFSALLDESLGKTKTTRRAGALADYRRAYLAAAEQLGRRPNIKEDNEIQASILRERERPFGSGLESQLDRMTTDEAAELLEDPTLMPSIYQEALDWAKVVNPYAPTSQDLQRGYTNTGGGPVRLPKFPDEKIAERARDETRAYLLSRGVEVE